MPGPYKPITEYKPLNLSDEVRRLDAQLDTHFAELVKVVRGDRPFDEDESANAMEFADLRDQFFRELFHFTAACNARPIRSVARLLDTLRYIERRPKEFGSDHTKFAPEAVDRLFRHYGGRTEVAHFEMGMASLLPSEISLAAAFAINEIEKETIQVTGGGRRGRPADTVLLSFAFKASVLFRATGGTPTPTEGGPFWQFVEILRMMVLGAAQEAGSSLTIESVVRKGSV